MTDIIIRVNLIRISLRVHEARFSYPDYFKERHTTLISITSGRLPQMHPDDQHRPSRYVCPDHWLKKSRFCTLLQQPAMAHVPPSVEWKDKMKWQQVTSHDHLPWSLSAACRVMMALPPPSVIMTTQNISPPLKKGTKLLILYIRTFTQRGR